MTVSFLAQIAPEGGKWKFAVVEHENETRDLFVRITSYFVKLISNIKVTIFWTKKIESASDHHCDVIFGFYMVKFGVK